MYCDITTTQTEDGFWRYECSRCDIVSYRSKNFKMIRDCREGPRLEPCIHLGKYTGKNFECRGCPSQARTHALLECALHGECLPLKVVTAPRATDKNSKAKEIPRSCQNCKDYVPDEDYVLPPPKKVEPPKPPSKPKHDAAWRIARLARKLLGMDE